MKPRNFIFVLLFVLAMLVACMPNNNDGSVETRHGTSLQTTASPELSAIDSLMWRQPDSALALLLPYFDTCCRDVACNVYPENSNDNSEDVARYVSTAYNRHYAHLLLSELLYKNDYKQSNRRDLQKAVTYFDSLILTLNDTPSPKRLIAGKDPLSLTRNGSIAFLDARAHYINGVGYYENDSVVDACKEYLKALEVMEEQFEEKELVGHKAHFMALTYTRLSMLFSDLYLHEQAIYFAQQSLTAYQRFESPSWFLARMLCEIGVQYDIMEQLDSADFYYNKATIVLNDTNSLLFRDIFTRKVYLSYKKKGLEESTLAQLDYIMSQSNSETEYLLRSLTKGEVFYQEKLLDSAWYYLYNVFKNTKNTASKRQAAEWLLDISKKQGKDDGIREYADFLAPFANQEENQSEIKAKITELYNVFRQVNLSKKHQQMVKKHITIGLVVFLGLLIGLLAYFLLYHNNRKQKQLLEKQIKEEQLSHDMKLKALSGRLKQSNQKLQDTIERIRIQELELKKAADNNTSFEVFNDRYEAFRQSQICLDILEKVNDLHHNKRYKLKTNADVKEYKAFALRLSQTAQLTKTVETFFPKLHPALKSQFAAMGNKEWLHCCLYLLQLDKMSICVLLQEPYYTCRRCTLKLEEAFDCRQGLSAFIIEQAKNC